MRILWTVVVIAVALATTGCGATRTTHGAAARIGPTAGIAPVVKDICAVVDVAHVDAVLGTRPPVGPCSANSPRPTWSNR